MTIEFRYRGRKISQEDILYIRALIEQHPQESRRTLSTKLCEAWQWRQANGALRDMVCQRVMPHVTHRRQLNLAGTVQHEQQAAAHHVAQRSIGLAPLPGFTELGR